MINTPSDAKASKETCGILEGYSVANLLEMEAQKKGDDSMGEGWVTKLLAKIACTGIEHGRTIGETIRALESITCSNCVEDVSSAVARKLVEYEEAACQEKHAAMFSGLPSGHAINNQSAVDLATAVMTAKRLSKFLEKDVEARCMGDHVVYVIGEELTSGDDNLEPVIHKFGNSTRREASGGVLPATVARLSGVPSKWIERNVSEYGTRNQRGCRGYSLRKQLSDAGAYGVPMLNQIMYIMSHFGILPDDLREVDLKKLDDILDRFAADVDILRFGMYELMDAAPCYGGHNLALSDIDLSKLVARIVENNKKTIGGKND